MKEKFQKEVITCFGGAFLIMFMIGIYFVYVPWNIDRLDITESELGINAAGIIISSAPFEDKYL